MLYMNKEKGFFLVMVTYLRCFFFNLNNFKVIAHSFAQFLVRYLFVNEAQVPSAGQFEEVQIGVILYISVQYTNHAFSHLIQVQQKRKPPKKPCHSAK